MCRLSNCFKATSTNFSGGIQFSTRLSVILGFWPLESFRKGLLVVSSEKAKTEACILCLELFVRYEQTKGFEVVQRTNCNHLLLK